MPLDSYKKKLVGLALELIEVQMILYIVCCFKFNEKS